MTSNSAPVDELGPVFTRADARRVGLTDDAIRHRLRTGRWVRLRRGVHTTAAAWEAASPRARHTLMVAALLRATQHPVVISHGSAAVLHGLPVMSRLPSRPAVTVPRRLRGLLDDVDIHLTSTHAAPPTTVTVDGPSGPIRATSPVRTLVDLAVTASRVDSTVAAEYAFRVGLCSPDDVRDEASRRSAPVRSATARLLDIADGRSSDDFSAALCAVLAHRVPQPDVLGLPVVLPPPHGLAHIAAAWPDVAVVARDRRLVDVVRSLGLQPVVVDPDELVVAPEVVVQRVSSALARTSTRQRASDVPVERRSSHARTTRSAIAASAALP